jgi:hypothetical protein
MIPAKSLKHDPRGPQVLIKQMQGFLASQKLAGPRDKIKAASKYFHAPATVNEIRSPLVTKLTSGFGSHRGGM